MLTSSTENLVLLTSLYMLIYKTTTIEVRFLNMDINIRLLLTSIILSVTVLSCTPQAEPKVDYDKISAQMMNDLAPQLVGTWKLSQVHVNPNGPNRINRLNLRKDSTFRDLATLTIVPADKPRMLPKDPRRGEYDGTIRYGSKTYPIKFDMWAGPQVYSGKGPQAFLLFSYRFPDGIHVAEPEEKFLEDLGLVDENFSLETTLGQPTMKWVGLNRGIDYIQFIKQ